MLGLNKNITLGVHNLTSSDKTVLEYQKSNRKYFMRAGIQELYMTT